MSHPEKGSRRKGEGRRPRVEGSKRTNFGREGTSEGRGGATACKEEKEEASRERKGREWRRGRKKAEEEEGGERGSAGRAGEVPGAGPPRASGRAISAGAVRGVAAGSGTPAGLSGVGRRCSVWPDSAPRDMSAPRSPLARGC